MTAAGLAVGVFFVVSLITILATAIRDDRTRAHGHGAPRLMYQPGRGWVMDTPSDGCLVYLPREGRWVWRDFWTGRELDR